MWSSWCTAVISLNSFLGSEGINDDAWVDFISFSRNVCHILNLTTFSFLNQEFQIKIKKRPLNFNQNPKSPNFFFLYRSSTTHQPAVITNTHVNNEKIVFVSCQKKSKFIIVKKKRVYRSTKKRRARSNFFAVCMFKPTTTTCESGYWGTLMLKDNFFLFSCRSFLSLTVSHACTQINK
jgi:hypothetical protein